MGIGDWIKNTVQPEVPEQDPSELYKLGLKYFLGQETEPDYDKAREYFLAAAQKEHGGALYALGMIAMQEGFYEEAAERLVAATQTDVEPQAAAWMDLGRLFLYEKHEPLKAAEFYKKAVEDGFGEGALMLGRIYSEAYLGGPQTDYDTALSWFNTAVEKGCLAARFFIGLLYGGGRAFPSDFQKAMENFRLVAEDGENLYCEDAANALGDLYSEGGTDSTGFTVERDIDKAREWYEKAAEKDYGPALYALSLLYREGWEGTAPDHEKTVELLRRGAAADYAPAQYALGCLYEAGFDDIIKPDEAVSIEWYKKAAENGNPSAQYEMGLVYSRGKGVPEDEEKAAEWFKKAAQYGHPNAMCELGEMAYFAKDPDFAEAFRWFTNAADSGSSLGTTMLGLMYDLGQHVQQDCGKAKELYEKGVAADNLEARFYLANIYRFGRGVSQDFDKARALYEEVLSSGYKGYNAPYLYYQLAELCRRGKGGPKDTNRAVSLYEQAADFGYPDAMQALADLYRSGDGIPEDEEKAQAWERKANERLYGNMKEIAAMQKRMKALSER